MQRMVKTRIKGRGAVENPVGRFEKVEAIPWMTGGRPAKNLRGGWTQLFAPKRPVELFPPTIHRTSHLVARSTHTRAVNMAVCIVLLGPPIAILA